jgi:hypothetical protein
MKPTSIETTNSAGGGDLAIFWAELVEALYDEDLARIIKGCPHPHCPQCVAVRAEMKRRKRRGIA